MLLKKSDVWNAKMYRSQQKIVLNAKLNSLVTFVQYVIYSMMSIKRNKSSIVKDVEYVELGVEKTFFIVIIVRVVCQIVKEIITLV